MCSADPAAGAAHVPRWHSASPGAGPNRRPIRLCVRSSESIASTLITAYLKSNCPDAEVFQENDNATFGGVRVELAGNGRWMFVAASFEETAHLARAVAEGASAAISLGARPEEMQLALQALISGHGFYLSPSSARWMAEAALARSEPHAEERPSDLPALTAREQEVLYLVSEGLSNEEIARALTISANTVRTHLHSLALKLETNSRASLIAKARDLLPASRGPEPVLLIDRTA